MFREMRRQDRKINTKEAQKLLTNAEYGILSTINADDYPYGVPVHFVFKNEAIYIHCAAEGQKLDNITKNPKVSFCVVGQTEVVPDEFTANYTSVILFGKAELIKGNEKHDALVLILEKYSPDYMHKGEELIAKAKDEVAVIKISIEHMSGKARR